MTATEMKDVLKREYGICSMSDFNDAVRESKGIDLGLFTKEVKDGVLDMSAHTMSGGMPECTGTAKFHL